MYSILHPLHELMDLTHISPLLFLQKLRPHRLLWRKQCWDDPLCIALAAWSYQPAQTMDSCNAEAKTIATAFRRLLIVSPPNIIHGTHLGKSSPSTMLETSWQKSWEFRSSAACICANAPTLWRFTPSIASKNVQVDLIYTYNYNYCIWSSNLDMSIKDGVVLQLACGMTSAPALPGWISLGIPDLGIVLDHPSRSFPPQNLL